MVCWRCVCRVSEVCVWCVGGWGVRVLCVSAQLCACVQCVVNQHLFETDWQFVKEMRS